MAGSRRKFRYTSDSGTPYSISLDESNGEATVTGGARITEDISGGETNKPQGFTPRYVLTFLQSNPLIKRKFIVGDIDAVQALSIAPGTISAPVYALADGSVPPAAVWVVTSYRGEKAPVAGAANGGDTGLTDGDAPN